MQRLPNVFTMFANRYATSPSEKTRHESWPGKLVGKATPVWQLFPPLPPFVACRAKDAEDPVSEKITQP